MSSFKIPQTHEEYQKLLDQYLKAQNKLKDTVDEDRISDITSNIEAEKALKPITDLFKLTDEVEKERQKIGLVPKKKNALVEIAKSIQKNLTTQDGFAKDIMKGIDSIANGNVKNLNSIDETNKILHKLYDSVIVGSIPPSEKSTIIGTIDAFFSDGNSMKLFYDTQTEKKIYTDIKDELYNVQGIDLKTEKYKFVNKKIKELIKRGKESYDNNSNNVSDDQVDILRKNFKDSLKIDDFEIIQLLSQINHNTQESAEVGRSEYILKKILSLAKENDVNVEELRKDFQEEALKQNIALEEVLKNQKTTKEIVKNTKTRLSLSPAFKEKMIKGEIITPSIEIKTETPERYTIKPDQTAINQVLNTIKKSSNPLSLHKTGEKFKIGNRVFERSDLLFSDRITLSTGKTIPISEGLIILLGGTTPSQIKKYLGRNNYLINEETLDDYNDLIRDSGVDITKTEKTLKGPLTTLGGISQIRLDDFGFDHKMIGKYYKSPEIEPNIKKVVVKKDEPLPPPGGSGIMQKKKNAYKIDHTGRFGNITIDPLQLIGHHKLDVKDVKGNGLMSETTDEDLVHLLTKRYNPRKKYTDKSQQQFRKLVKLSGLPVASRTGKFQFTQKSKSSETPLIKIISDPNELIERMSVLCGEIQAGNNNVRLKNELSQILDILLNKGILGSAEHKNITQRYS